MAWSRTWPSSTACGLSSKSAMMLTPPRTIGDALSSPAASALERRPAARARRAYELETLGA
jgi:hypothetical protein